MVEVSMTVYRLNSKSLNIILMNLVRQTAMRGKKKKQTSTELLKCLP